MRHILNILIISVLLSCSPKPNGQEKKLDKFEIPTIIQTENIDSVTYFVNRSLSETRGEFISKYKFSESITISEKQDTSLLQDFIWEYFRPYDDSLATDGFQLKTDYKTTFAHRSCWGDFGHYFPVFVVNETNETKLFLGKVGSMFAIQEALDSSRQWRPIESNAFEFCGNAYWGLKVHPKEFVLFVMPKYSGDFETLLRVRLKIGDNIYVSQPYKGTINPNQFYLKRNDRKQIKNDPVRSIKYEFYGAIPKECDMGELKTVTANK